MIETIKKNLRVANSFVFGKVLHFPRNEIRTVNRLFSNKNRVYNDMYLDVRKL